MGTSIIKVQDDHIEHLIDEGCRLDAQIKDLADKLSGIKTELEVLSKGKHKTTDGNCVTVSEMAQYSVIEPEEAKKALREKRLGRNFLLCVKVNITNLKRYLSDQEMEGLRSIESYSRRYSFK